MKYRHFLPLKYVKFSLEYGFVVCYNTLISKTNNENIKFSIYAVTEVVETECGRCGQPLLLLQEYISWDYNGTGYDTKLCKCVMCGTKNPIKYVYDSFLREYEKGKEDNNVCI